MGTLDYQIISNFDIKINRDNVLYLIDCRRDSPIYEEVLEEYIELEKTAYSLIEPAAIIKFGKLDFSIALEQFKGGEPVIYVLTTVGSKISQLSSTYFREGDYLSAMLIDAMADDYLIQIEKEIHKVIKEECALRNLGISERLEAPQNIPMRVQKVVLDETKALEKLNIDVTTGYMFTVVKSTCHILVLTENKEIFKIQHDCSKCTIINCKLRQIPKVNIRVISKDKVYTIECEKSESILEALIKQGIYLRALCGGKGNCGKCKIKLLEGKLALTVDDKAQLTKKQVEEGIRLACKAYPKEDCTIKIEIEDESDFEVISNYPIEDPKNESKEEGYVIGIDIGTTTIAISLVKIDSKEEIKSFTTINKQRVYGADVISRIQASNEGKKKQLQESIRDDLLQGIKSVIKEAMIDKCLVKKIAIAGNTTMGHLLMGYSCETLGLFPFTPVNINTIEKSFYEILGDNYLDAPVILLPGISTYVGADIAAGLLICDFDTMINPCMLIDLGTNGEIAIGNKDRILVSSTAAGPAFEGGNISSGVGSIAGAISNISIEGNKARYKTIGGESPIGICGTGVIEMTAELLKAELMDETGLLEEAYFKEGYKIVEDSKGGRIAFTQKDIREIQLAKAAIRAGIETLIRKYGITYDEIETVYLAGGFGYKIDIEKAVCIGLLPKGFAGKIKAIGNGSLGGAIKYLTDKNGNERIKRILQVSEEINLSNDINFNELYMENMLFTK